MSNMKDYMMWLDDRGVANWDNSIGELIIPERTDVYAPELVDEYHNDGKWHDTDYELDDDEDMIEDDNDDNGLMDDDDLGDYYEWTPNEYWFTECGGLTADAQTYLHDLDSKGELV